MWTDGSKSPRHCTEEDQVNPSPCPGARPVTNRPTDPRGDLRKCSTPRGLAPNAIWYGVLVLGLGVKLHVKQVLMDMGMVGVT